jgi:hypothetical protein
VYSFGRLKTSILHVNCPGFYSFCCVYTQFVYYYKLILYTSVNFATFFDNDKWIMPMQMHMHNKILPPSQILVTNIGTEGVYHWINLALQISLNKISSFLHDGSLIVFESQTKMSLDFKIPSFRQKEVAKRARTLGCVVYTSEPLAAKYPSCKVVWVHFCCCIRTHCTQLTNMIHKKFAPFVMIEWII